MASHFSKLMMALLQQQQAGGGAAGLVSSVKFSVTTGPVLDRDFSADFPQARAGDVLVGIGASSAADLNSGSYNLGTLNPTKRGSQDAGFPGNVFLTATWDGSNTTITSSLSITSESRECAWVFALFRGFTEVGASSAGSEGLSGEPDPPSLTGTAVGSLILAWGALDDDVLTDALPPSGYTLVDWLNSNQTPGQTAAAMLSYKTGDGGTEDPSAFSTGGSDRWYAGTVGLPAV